MYSQNDEERVILQHLGGPTGRLVDLGAYDGRTFSNSLALIERGWSALLVEPSPGPFYRCLQVHRANPNVTLVNALAVPDHAKVGDLVGLEATDDAVSTTEAAFANLWRPAIKDYRKILVAPVRVSALVRQVEALGWTDLGLVNVDTEGTTVDLLADLVRHPIFSSAQLFCVEHVALGRDYRAEVAALLPGHQVVHVTGENLILARR